MKNYIKNIFIITLFTGVLNAYSDGIDNIYSFIGVQGGYSTYDNIDAPTIGISYGKQNSEWRTKINYNYANGSNNDFHSLIIQVDRGIFTELFMDYPFKPYIGFSLGIMEHTKGSFNDIGYLFGGDIGVNYVLNNSMDIDLGYKYMDTKKLKKIGDRGDLMLSLHYYFE